LKQNKSASVQKKITVFFVSFTAIILVLLWVCLFFFLDTIYHGIRINEMENAAKSIEARQGGSFSIAAEQVCEKSGMCVTVFNYSNYSTVFTGEGMERCSLHRLSVHNLSQIEKYCVEHTNFFSVSFNERKGTFSLSRELYDDDSESSVVCVTVTEGDNGERILIFVNARISPVGAVKTTMLWLLSFFSVLFVIIAFVLAFFVSKHIAKPIMGINSKAKLLAAGDFELNFEDGGYLEAQELSRTLNYAASELGKVEALRRELIANLSHDLRTPLTLISSYSEMMRDIPGELNKDNLSTVIDEADRLNSLVNDMMSVSKLESGNTKIKKSVFSLTKEISSYVERYNEMLSHKGYSIEFSFAEEVFVNSDCGMILQAFGNLLNNAVTYTGEDKKVFVSQQLDGGIVRIEVRDTGEGISKDKLPLIWERYYKIDGSHRRSEYGSGLGLSIVKKIIALHGGSCGVRSSLGRGSTFWFELDIYRSLEE